MNTTSFTWKITSKWHGKLLKDFLLQEVKVSRRALTDLKFHGGKISINGDDKTVRYQLQEADEVEITFPEEIRSTKLQPEPIPLQIVYEDSHLLIINKVAGMSTIPSREHPNHSVANALLHHYNKQDLSYAVHVVTRLDRDTSGLLLIAKHRFCHHLLSLEQREGTINRTYEAIVHGTLIQEKGKIDLPIGRKPDSIIERTVIENGKRAITNFTCLNRNNHSTYVQLTLETGRTHQIRVHMSAIGHPLFGDDLYGGKREQIHRQALHCSNLTFIHPFTKEKMNFSCQLPNDMKKLLTTSNL
jgi:23S rRNA pseudouridine1911/1915/1917 synthase